MNITSAPKQHLEQPPEIRDWYFTFGYGQRLFAGRRDTDQAPTVADAEGIHLDGVFVKIRGTFHGARQTMIRYFGMVWCDQYAELPRVPGYEWKFLDLAHLIEGEKAFK